MLTSMTPLPGKIVGAILAKRSGAVTSAQCRTQAV